MSGALPKSARIGVVGAGAMGQGIAQVAAAAGHPVALYDAQDGMAEKARGAIGKAIARLVEKGRMEAAEKDALLERIRPVGKLEDFAGSALVIEAVVERLDIKQEVFRTVQRVCGPEAILASNTSSISLSAIAAPLDRPGRVCGMHFFNPAPLMALVEVISGLQTEPAVADAVFATAAAWGKTPVRAASTPGFIVNRVARPFYGEALRLLEEGAADAPTIDACLKEAGGFRMGPFELMDLIGNDVNYTVTSTVFEAYSYDPRYLPSLVQKEMVAAGRLGRKSGLGYYPYGEGVEKPAPQTAAGVDPPAAAIVEGDLGPAEPLVPALEAAGIAVKRDRGPGLIRTEATTLALTDGRTATARAAEEEIDNLVLFDLALDYAAASRLAVAKADQAGTEALGEAVGLLQALGKSVSVVDDAPGLILMRTLAMLANEGADAVLQGVASAEGVDTAMLKGVNYPVGPLAWADAIGPTRVLDAIDNLAAVYGLDRYRASALLRRKVAGGSAFHA